MTWSFKHFHWASGAECLVRGAYSTCLLFSVLMLLWHLESYGYGETVLPRVRPVPRDLKLACKLAFNIQMSQPKNTCFSHYFSWGFHGKVGMGPVPRDSLTHPNESTDGWPTLPLISILTIETVTVASTHRFSVLFWPWSWLGSSCGMVLCPPFVNYKYKWSPPSPLSSHFFPIGSHYKALAGL